MKALRLKEPKSRPVLEEVEPPKPGAGQVVVELRAAAFNRRDYWITQGLYPDVQTPVTLGSDGAGVVLACGQGVDPAWVGREVILNPGLDWGEREQAQSPDFSILGMPTDGTFAEQVAVPATNLHDKPAHLNWDEAAALPLGGLTAYRAVAVQGRCAAGQTAMISGVGGGVATFALQFAKAL
ncbi:MAG: alcohol dehydrogenase catalytic domain-containing protein, partial [Phycisphaeraceae bacterium]|nr:alcohol dehydrogenase catalytic domain-containing protein [Phycisphaeraceae bacterium]